jgi:hypothetical protein
MKTLFYVLIVLAVGFSFACSVTETNNFKEKNVNKAVSPKKPNENKAETPEIKENPSDSNLKTSSSPKPGKSETEYKLAKKKCEAIDTGDNILLKSQTFPFDEKPFEGSCFVTEHNAEFDDPPIGSEISIYKDGKRVYRFDSRYNPDSATCYVKAVAFEDLNDDGLMDVIVSGECGAKSGDLIGNEVFINTGNDFYTSTEANDKLEVFTKIKDVADFVRKNKKTFEPGG